MRKQLKKVLILCCIQTGGVLIATSFIRSPSYYDPLYLHYPLDPTGDYAWEIETISGFYERVASKTFRDQCATPVFACPSECATAAGCTNTNGPQVYNKVTTEKSPLAALFFGKACFLGEEAFACGMLTQPCNPFLFLSKLCPRFEYEEAGCVIGGHAYTDWERERGAWRLGVRAQLPIKAIDMRQTNACGTEQIEQEAGDTVVYAFQNVIPGNQNSMILANGYRFDLLNSLQAQDGTPLVTYTSPGGLAISGIQIGVQDKFQAAMAVLKKDDGEITFTPPVPPVNEPNNNTYVLSNDINGGPLPADGSGVNNDYYFLNIKTNYTPIELSRAAQQTLFLVASSGQGNGLSYNTTILVQNVIDQAITELNLEGLDSAIDFFANNCVSFCKSERVVGAGDLDLSVYGGFHADHGFADLLLRLGVPTGKKNHDPRKLLFQPTGNNGHVEFGFDLEGGWKPCDCFGLQLGAAYSHVFRAKEKKAAPFVGATVINIGPIVDAKVSWGYFTGHVDGTVFHPRNSDLGFTFGYELYAKRDDKVSLCATTATDFCGNINQPLDAKLLEVNTNTQTHKLRGSVFHRFNYFELYGGASYIIAGKNAMQEAEWHIGCSIYF